jgi:hypothetical protein
MEEFVTTFVQLKGIFNDTSHLKLAVVSVCLNPVSQVDESEKTYVP